MAKKIEGTKIKFRIRWWMWLLLILVIGAVAGWRYWSTRDGAVDVATVEKGEVVEELILTGEIKAVEHATLAFQSSGELVWIGVNEGDVVKKGQMLAKLDTVTLNATYQQALSNLRAAEATVDRVHDDVKDNDVDESFAQKETRTTAEAAKDRAYDAVIIARRNLRNAGLIAPFDGIVAAITNPFSGINTSFTQGQIEVVNPETMYFEVSADQTEVIDLRVGQEVKINMDAYPDDDFLGKISSVSYTPKVDVIGTVYGVKVAFDNLDTSKLRIGMTGDAIFVINRKTGVLYVPPKFVNSNKGERYLNVGRKNNRVNVQVGIEGEGRTEVTGEIKEGDVIYD